MAPTVSSKERHPIGALEVLLPLAFITMLQLEVWVFGDFEPRAVLRDVLISVISVLTGGALVLVRARPIIAFAANGIGVFTLIAFAGPSNFYQWTNLMALYFVAVSAEAIIAWPALALSLAGVFWYFRAYPDEGDVTVMIMVMLLWTVAWLVGRVYGSRAEQDRLRTERDLSTELAEARKVRLELESERTSMAHELHDILGHTLNVMLVHAGAARRALPEHADQAISALETIETTGRSAMDDLDRVLGLLRVKDGEAPRKPLPGIDDLATLAGTTGAGTIDVDIDIDASTDSISKPVQLTIYRIAQEALTNVLKHARAKAVRIEVAQSGETVRLDVWDDGAGVGDAAPGHGLDGMRRRAELHGGCLRIEPGTGGGTHISCTIPTAS